MIRNRVICKERAIRMTASETEICNKNSKSLITSTRGCLRP